MYVQKNKITKNILSFLRKKKKRKHQWALVIDKLTLKEWNFCSISVMSCEMGVLISRWTVCLCVCVLDQMSVGLKRLKLGTNWSEIHSITKQKVAVFFFPRYHHLTGGCKCSRTWTIKHLSPTDSMKWSEQREDLLWVVVHRISWSVPG